MNLLTYSYKIFSSCGHIRNGTEYEYFMQNIQLVGLEVCTETGNNSSFFTQFSLEDKQTQCSNHVIHLEYLILFFFHKSLVATW